MVLWIVSLVKFLRDRKIWKFFTDEVHRLHNFKWPSMQIRQCPTYNGRLHSTVYLRVHCTVQCTFVYTAQYSVLACTLHSTVPYYYNPLNVLLSDQQCGIYIPLILWIHRCWILSNSFLLYAAKIHKFNWQLLTYIYFTSR